MTYTPAHPAGDTAVVPPPPPRRRRTVALAAVAGVVLVAGSAFAVTLAVTGDGDEPATTTTSPPAKDAVQKPADPGAADGGSGASAPRPATAQPATGETAPSAKEPGAKAPAGATGGGHQPDGPYTTEFGFLTAVEKSGTTYTLTVDQAQLLTGKAAADYYAAHPDQEKGIVAIVNENPRLRRYRLTDDAVLNGGGTLGGTSGDRTRRITPAELKLAIDTLPDDWQVPVNLVHNADGRVSNVREQYIP